METIVIGDIHHKVDKVDRVFEKEGHSRAIFIGDYFDDFGDDVTTAQYTASWLKHSIHQPDRIHLMGNHDVPYRYNGRYNCPGWDQDKHDVINEILTASDWEKIKLIHIQEDHIFSHAGISRSILPVCPVNGTSPERILEAADEALQDLSVGKSELLLERIDAPAMSGVTWIRPWQFQFPEWELYGDWLPTQVFGHTPVMNIKRVTKKLGELWLIDAFFSKGQYCILEDGEMEVRSL